MALTEGTYTWEYGDSNQALWFNVSYNTVTNQWTVEMKKGSMDLNAIWWSNDNTAQDGDVALSKADNSLNMNGTNVVWDGYNKISDTGLTGKEHNGSSLLTAGNIYTYGYSATQGTEFETLLATGVVTLGIRATSVNGTSSIKSVNTGYDSFTPSGSSNHPPTIAPEVAGPLTDTADYDDFSNLTGQLDGSDDDNNPLTYGLASGQSSTGTYGSLTVNADGTYTYTPDDAAINALKSGSFSDVFNVQVSDGIAAPVTTTLTVNIIAANDTATISVNGTPDTTVTEAGGTNNGSDPNPTASGDLDVADVDTGDAKFQIPGSLAGTYGNFSFNADTGVWSYSLNNDAAATQALTTGQQVTDSLTVSSFDGTDSETITVNITGANDASVISDVGGTPTDFYGPSAPVGGVVVDGSITLADVDDANLDSATVSITSGFSAGDTLTFTNQNGITGSFSGSTLTLSGSASKANYEAALESIKFTTANGVVGDRTIAFTVNDGEANSNTQSATVTVKSDPNDFDSGSGTFTGTDGNDSLTGAPGNVNETFYGRAGNDTINGGGGDDLIYAGSGNDTSDGQNQNDTLFGGAGNDTLVGSQGVDRLIGGFGDDQLTGGNGNDVFVFNSPNDALDTITDFVTSGPNEYIELSASGFTSLTAGGIGAAVTGGYLTYSSNTLFYDADGTAGSGLGVAIVNVAGLTLNSTTNDIVIV